jgi:A/G-specific adenine glycosylase
VSFRPARSGGNLLFDAPWRRAFRRRMAAWFDRNAKPLPWRRNRDPYAVWVSEIMLQQTQVGTVAGYFDRFLAALPTINALAAADEHDVLRLWEGLGYYRRARQLHEAAKIVVAEHGGVFPRDFDAVRRLPGIGRYTAGAILSIAFDARLPILEANTVRLLSRLLAYPGDPQSAEGQRVLWAAAESVLPRRGSGRMNQAMMELGREVCTARTPQCNACPVAAQCRAHQQDRQHDIPPPKARRAIEPVVEAAVVVRRRGRVLLVRWPEGRRFAGLWDFPRFPLHSHRPADVRRELADNVLSLTGALIAPGRHIETLTHGVTRFRITLECYEAEFLSNSRAEKDRLETRWLRPAELAAYPLSSTGRKLACRVRIPTRSVSQQ